MNIFEIDCAEISGVFKENLKVENTLKTISSMFLNHRYLDKVDYAPYFQRNYVWDKSKASYFVESILLGTDIPPIVLFEDGKKLEVIDGRQRYETLLKFVSDEIPLKVDGLRMLTGLAGKKFSELDQDMRNKLEDTKIRILQFSVVNEPGITVRQKDKIKKEIFNRYNSGITALKTPEIERADYNDDSLTSYIHDRLIDDEELFQRSEKLFIAPRRRKGQKRDRVNFLLSRIRMLLALPSIPIRSYAYGKSKPEIIKVFFKKQFVDVNYAEILKKYDAISKKVDEFTMLFNESDRDLASNLLLHEVCYWGFSIVYDHDSLLFEAIDSKQMADEISNADESSALWQGIPDDYTSLERVFSQTGSHYSKAVISRYLFIANCLSLMTKIDFGKKIKDPDTYTATLSSNMARTQYEDFRVSKPDPHAETVYDILQSIKKSRFMIRPSYQRSEVNDATKASYLLESILLGIKVPPIFVCKRDDGVSEVIDGQQRLLSIIGFLGESYLDENGIESFSVKNGFRLKGLRILTNLNHLNIEEIKLLDEKYYDKILDFGIDVVEIDKGQNPYFDPIDLFLRLNQKPYPIKPNSFEMWNSYIDRGIVDRAKEIAISHSGAFFKADNTRMAHEELVTTLAYVAYQTASKGLEARDVFDIFVRNEKVNARVREKTNITRTLDEVSEASPNEFISALDVVDSFLIKLEMITGKGFPKLKELVCAHGAITNQIAYLLWITLVDADEKFVSSNSEEIFAAINLIFHDTQTVRADFDIDSFLDQLVEICKS
ncbi:DUF262 domain-containing protein [Eggerthella sinensis]|uniref:DUF262 domain-containing protein n=1 Tax=Eggerthella sinensis TaxID=242230 RepID=UPI0022E2C08D|nr:DUF262 domain-containing protein [Eggerthella sinensis]